MIQNFNQENIIFIKEYSRKVFDRQILLEVDTETGEPRYAFKDSNVLYFRIKKERDFENE